MSSEADTQLAIGFICVFPMIGAGRFRLLADNLAYFLY